LDFIAGGGRVIAGCGIGNWDVEFEAIGLGGWDRREVLEEYVSVLRQLWTGDAVSHDGQFYRFADVQLRPVPSDEESIPVWYGGNSAAAARRAAEYCDGLVASRIPLANFVKRMKRMRRIAGERGRVAPTAAVIPYVVPADTVQEGMARLSLAGLLDDLNAHEPPPASGRYETFDDVDGAAVAGPASVIIDAVRRFQAEGAEHFIFDLRPCLEDWEDRLAYLGEHVLPALHREDLAASAHGERHSARAAID